jgi:hypothetical protein
MNQSDQQWLNQGYKLSGNNPPHHPLKKLEEANWKLLGGFTGYFALATQIVFSSSTKVIRFCDSVDPWLVRHDFPTGGSFHPLIFPICKR